MQNRTDANKIEVSFLWDEKQDERTKQSAKLNRHYHYTDQEIEQLYNQEPINQTKP